MGRGKGCFAPGRVTFCADRKSPKNRLGEGGFRFPPSPRYPILLKRPTSSSRTSYPSPGPKGQGSLIPSLVLSQWNPLRWASIGSPLRPPYWMYPPGGGNNLETSALEWACGRRNRWQVRIRSRCVFTAILRILYQPWRRSNHRTATRGKKARRDRSCRSISLFKEHGAAAPARGTPHP